MHDIFISYSRKDIAFARLIRGSLQENQLDTWIDWDRIPVGVRWWQEICEAIANSNIFMFIVSRDSIGSNVCGDEIGQALKHNKRIIPVLLDDLKPEALKEFVPDLPEFNWIVFQRDRVFHLETNSAIQSDTAEDREVALPQLPQFYESLIRLNKAIRTDWEWVKYHTQLQVSALHWEANGKSPAYLLEKGYLRDAERWVAGAEGKDPQPTTLQVEFIEQSKKKFLADKEKMLADSGKWWRKEPNTSHYAPDFELVCVNCRYSYTFTPSEHIPIPAQCPECKFKGFGRFGV
ncbi:MAG: TIR domain protein [Planctomycetes bacterium ADurb.Bin126]|nr:MAG: TIR domain protein [Planctomycetes bacterium ADurb.Bin126]HOD82856.1 toll/interleukin-1 receptor domain-containing protein [Phycisphaerae bacterium]